jgi:hypothetical protein
MSTAYFSDREVGPRPRIHESISEEAWGGIVSLVRRRIDDGSFSYRFPITCEDSQSWVYATDRQEFALALRSEIPDIEWPLRPYDVPPVLTVLDLLEFCHKSIAHAKKTLFHDYGRHHHLELDPVQGRLQFRTEVNRILARNGVAYELQPNGQVVRLAPPMLREALQMASFRTGDADLDHLLESAREKYVHTDEHVRRDALEKLWDAWERLKTLENPSDKKDSIRRLLDRIANEPTYRSAIESEAKALTEIGNGFRIRHSEVGKAPLGSSQQVDYFFHRLFAFIRSALVATGRGG